MGNSITLHWAAYKDRKEVAELLIAEGADVNEKGGVNMTPLNIAAQEGHNQVVELLIANGADVNGTGGPFGGTPFHSAATKEIAEVLIAAGADVNAKNNRDMTPVHQAALSGRNEITGPLIAGGSDVNAKDEDGDTPLDNAKHKPEIADLLRKHCGLSLIHI